MLTFADVTVLSRPAHLNVTLNQMFGLMNSPYAKEASYYVEYFPLSAIKQVANELGDFVFADFLNARFRLIWLGGKTNGRLHFDRNENLMGMIAGYKSFYLFDPSQSESLYGGMPMHGANLMYGFVGDEHMFVRSKENVNPVDAESFTNTMSPVNIRDPDYERVRYARVRARVLTSAVATVPKRQGVELHDRSRRSALQSIQLVARSHFDA
jgi:hypothetical protein